MIVSIKSEDGLPGFLFKYQGLQQYAHAGAGLAEHEAGSGEATGGAIYIDKLLLDILLRKKDQSLFERAFSAMVGHELCHIVIEGEQRSSDAKEIDDAKVEARAAKFEAIFDPNRLLRKIIAEVEDSILDQTIYGIEFSTVHGERRAESAAKSILGSPLRDELKDVYRTLARKYHPDISKGDERQTIRFKFVNAAYELLQGNIDWSEFNKRIRGEKEKLRELNFQAADSIISVEEMESAYTDERERAFADERNQDIAITLMNANTVVDQAVRMPRTSSQAELRDAVKTYSRLFQELNLSQKKACTSSWHFFGLALRETGRYDDAITLGAQFMDDDYDIYSGMIDAYSRKGDLEKAEDLLREFPKVKEIGRFVLAMQYYRDAYRAAIVDAHYFIGRGYARKDDPVAARYFGKARDMSQDYFNLSYKPAILEQYRAIRRNKDRQTEKSAKKGWMPEHQLEDELREALELVAEGDRQSTRRLFCPARARMGAEAVKIFEQIPLAQIDHSRYAAYHLKWGIAEMWQGNYDNAIEVLRRFLLSSPDFYNSLIYALALKGETNRAEKLLEEDPLRAMKDKIDGYYFLGLAYLLKGEHRKAHEHLHLAYQNTKGSRYFNQNTRVNNETIEMAYFIASSLPLAAESHSDDLENDLKTAVHSYYQEADYEKAWILFREAERRSNSAAGRVCERVHRLITAGYKKADAGEPDADIKGGVSPLHSRIVCSGITDREDDLFGFEAAGPKDDEQNRRGDGLFTARSSLRSNRLHDALRFFQQQRSRIVREFGLNTEAAKKRRIYYDVHFGIQLVEAMLDLRSRRTEESHKLRKMLKEAGEQYFVVQDYKTAAQLCAEVGRNGIPKARRLAKLIEDLLDIGFRPLLDKLEKKDVQPDANRRYYKYLKTDDGVRFLIVFDSKGEAKKFLSSSELSPTHIRDALHFICASTKSRDDRLTLIGDLAEENDLESAVDESGDIDGDLRDLIESFRKSTVSERQMLDLLTS